MKTRALFIGDVSWDTTVVATRIPEQDEKVLVEDCVDAIGGVAANAAAACALADTDVLLASTVGSDAMGVAVKADLERLGLSSCIETTEGPTARAVIFLDGGGEKRLFLYPGDRMYPSGDLATRLDLSQVGWMHTALYDRAVGATMIARCREAGIPWSIDLEPATIPSELSELAPHLGGCAVVILNSRAAALLGDEAVDRVRALGARTIIETLGPAGVRVHTEDGAMSEVAPAPSGGPVRDTTGAGDAFAGWLIAETLRGASLADATVIAAAAASYSVRTVGTIASYPTRGELLTVRQSARERRMQ